MGDGEGLEGIGTFGVLKISSDIFRVVVRMVANGDQPSCGTNLDNSIGESSAAKMVLSDPQKIVLSPKMS